MNEPKHFALIGAAGYIAPRHMQAIKDTGNQLLAMLDPSDSVGVVDQFFPQAEYFSEFERFDRHIDKLRRRGRKIDFVSICSPNYLHDAHIRFGLRNGADVICEKPLVLNPWNVAALREIEHESQRKVHTILQLRLHPAIAELKRNVDAEPPEKRHQVQLTSITSRGKWYQFSWKGNPSKSGGIATNIGVHFFDMLAWIFGKCNQSNVHLMDSSAAAGSLQLEKADVKWYMSLNLHDVPQQNRDKGDTTFRSMLVDGKEVVFTKGFTDLHTRSYQEILAGNGFGIQEAGKAVEIVYQIRNATPTPDPENQHPFCNA